MDFQGLPFGAICGLRPRVAHEHPREKGRNEAFLPVPARITILKLNSFSAASEL